LNLVERLGILSIIPTNQTLADITNETSNLIHSNIEIGQNVTWTQTVMVNDTRELQNILIELPADAQNIQIETTNEQNQTEIIPNEILIIYPESEQIEYDEEFYEASAEEHYETIDDAIQKDSKDKNYKDAKSKKQNDVKDTKQKDSKDKKLNKKIEKLTDKLFKHPDNEKLKSKLDKLVEKLNVTNYVPLDLATLEEIDDVKQDAMPIKLILINETKSENELDIQTIQNNNTLTEEKEYTIKYQTPAPFTTEKNYSTELHYQKNVTVAHNSTLHYTNIKSYTDLPEDRFINVIWYCLWNNVSMYVISNGFIGNFVKNILTHQIGSQIYDIPVCRWGELITFI